MKEHVEHHWNPLVEVLGRDKRFYMFRFPNQADMLSVLGEGPYSVYGALLVLRRWVPAETVLRDVSVTEILVWVQLFGFPPESVNVISGNIFASVIGPVEEINISNNPPFHLRVRVWIHLNKPLLSGFCLKLSSGSVIQVSCRDEQLFNFCSKCRVINHSFDSCSITSEADLEQFLTAWLREITERSDFEFCLDQDSGGAFSQLLRNFPGCIYPRISVSRPSRKQFSSTIPQGPWWL